MHLGEPRGWGKIHQRYQALQETKNLFVNCDVDAQGNLPESNDESCKVIERDENTL